MLWVTYEFAGWGKTTGPRLPPWLPEGCFPMLCSRIMQNSPNGQDKGLLGPLDKFVDSGTIDFSNVEDSALSGGMIDGQLYAVNIGLNSMCMVLDADQFAAAGVSSSRSKLDLGRVQKDSIDSP